MRNFGILKTQEKSDRTLVNNHIPFFNMDELPKRTTVCSTVY